VVVGEFVPDLITPSAIVADAKVIDRITDHERGPLINYLRITNAPGGRHPEFQTRQTAMGAHCPLTPDSCYYPANFVEPRKLSGGTGARLSPAAAAPPRRAPADWPTPSCLRTGCGSGDPRSAWVAAAPRGVHLCPFVVNSLAL
jgi:hypothetical protein